MISYHAHGDIKTIDPLTTNFITSVRCWLVPTHSVPGPLHLVKNVLAQIDLIVILALRYIL